MNKDLLGVRPEIVEQAKKVGEYLSIEVRKHRDEGKLEVRYIPIHPWSYLDLGTLVDELSAGLVWGHVAAFGMGCTLTAID